MKSRKQRGDAVWEYFSVTNGKEGTGDAQSDRKFYILE
jgi:hypothetical protein